MKYLKASFDALMYFLFKRNLNLFDFFIILIVADLARELSLWYILLLLPLSFFSSTVEFHYTKK